jgi:16S rRNA (uracil1498-N3)-methyltransferase
MTVRLYIDAPLARDAEFELPASAARHVQVRRLQPADRLVLFNGQGGEWAAWVVRMGRSVVTVRVGEPVAVERELHVRVTLALGMPANERMDLLVEKATELGVFAIQPLLCERSVLRLAGDRAQRKREHWQAVAAAAAEQCARTRVPQLAPVLHYERWLGSIESEGRRLLLSFREGATALPAAAEVARAGALLCLSGPEGGLTPAEEAAALAQGFVATRLGERVLRAETAPLAVLAWIGLDPAAPVLQPGSPQ